jgi:lysozyme
MIASRIAVDLIARREDFRAEAYQDAKGVWTIGFGTTAGVKPGDRMAVPRALKRLMDDIAKAEAAVELYIEIPLKQHEFDALVSLTYNVGAGALQKSTLRRKLNAGDREGAIAEFHRWVYSGGQKLAGLMDRRKEEADLFRGES